MRPNRLSDEERVRLLQRKLCHKAKEEKGFRFYVLYDKVRIGYVLREAYRRCREKGKSPGIDGVTFEMIENEEGVTAFLDGIRKELEEKAYKPQMVKRAYVPKANGQQRPLGIPTIKDRVVQQACKMVIEPIFEADFEDESYGFRPKRSASDAMTKIKENLKTGYTEVLDADLSAFFDTIPHRELMILLEMRISDRNVLNLIRMWLKAPVWEDGKVSGGKRNGKGTPQGGVISPLLANIYLTLLDKAVNRKDGPFSRSGIRIVRYADDFVLMGKAMSQEAIVYLGGLLGRMKLKLNEEKTRRVNAKQESFDFLGFTVRWVNSQIKIGTSYWNITPSKKSLNTIRGKIRACLKANGHLNPRLITIRLNQLTRGWVNYFTVPRVSYPAMAKRKLRWYLMDRLNRYYRRKSQRASGLYRKGAFEVLQKKYGLFDPWSSTRPPVPASAL